LTPRALKRLQTHAESLPAAPHTCLDCPPLSGTRFIAVTGRRGKTQTKELVAAILARRGRTHRSFGSNKKYFSVARTILELRPSHRYCVIELGASGRDSWRRPIDLPRPDVAVVTSINPDHYRAFRGATAAASEKQGWSQPCQPREWQS
jgi:UDP-N-acetylmuramoyl-tripeptide--D-alanyl-D-alanine ligase